MNTTSEVQDRPVQREGSECDSAAGASVCWESMGQTTVGRHCGATDVGGIEKWVFVAGQFTAAVTGHVTCRCGRLVHLRRAYRCLYCQEYYCAPCAEAHFGMTRSAYSTEHAHFAGYTARAQRAG